MVALLHLTGDVSTAAVAAGLLLLLAVWTTLAFNRLVRHRNLVREAWAGIDVQLKRRHDLVPNLVEVVQTYADYEQDLLRDIARLRTEAASTSDPSADKAASENALSGRLHSLLALAEAYPELLANRSFLDLQEQLVEIEDHLQMARRYYNGTVRDYNIRVESFPSNLIASLFSFSRAEFFEIEASVRTANPAVGSVS